MTTPRSQYYDLDQIKAISILDAARMLGLHIESRGGTYRCKIRAERTASVVLHLPNAAKYPNSFHDFGSNRHGDVIDLVCAVQNVSQKEAIKVLANAFGIEPIDPRKGLSPNDLTHKEYEKIGLYGDRAAKNFSFNPDKQSVERIHELSQKYAMPMNDLREKHPKVYEQIIRDKAIPYVRTLRNEYYFDVYSKYHFFKQMSAEDLFHNENTKTWFKEHHIDALTTAERLLDRACKGTSIKSRPIGEYDPIQDLQKLQRGELKPTVTPDNYDTMKRAAQERSTTVKYQPVEFSQYLSKLEALGSFTHSAFLGGSGKVVIGYLESDKDAIKPILAEPKRDIDQQLGSAVEHWLQSQAEPDKQQGGFEPQVDGDAIRQAAAQLPFAPAEELELGGLED